MDDPQDTSATLALLDSDGGHDLSRNATQFVPPRNPAQAGAIAKRPTAPRMLLADRIDRQFPLIRSA